MVQGPKRDLIIALLEISVGKKTPLFCKKMPNSCISSVEITLKYFQVIDLIASFFMKNKYRALSQLRSRKWAQKGVNEVSFLTK